MFTKSEKPAFGKVADEEAERPKEYDLVGKSSGMPSILSADLKVIGELKSKGEIQVDGTIEGDVTGGDLTISPGGRVDGSITAERVHVSGSVEGRIEAKTVVITKTAKVLGDVVHQDLEVEAGALIEGHISRLGSG